MVILCLDILLKPERKYGNSCYSRLAYKYMMIILCDTEPSAYIGRRGLRIHNFLSGTVWVDFGRAGKRDDVGVGVGLTPDHYNDVIMTTIASQITSLTVVHSTIYSNADQRKHQSSASLAFVWGIHRDRWIPRTKGQLRGKCFHLMTSSCGVMLRHTTEIRESWCQLSLHWWYRRLSLWQPTLPPMTTKLASWELSGFIDVGSTFKLGHHVDVK